MLLIDLSLIVLVSLTVYLELIDNSLTLRIELIKLSLLGRVVIHLLLELSLTLLKLSLILFELFLIGFILSLHLAEVVDHGIVVVCYTLNELKLHQHIVEVLRTDKNIGVGAVACDIECSEPLLELTYAGVDLVLFVSDHDLAYADLLCELIYLSADLCDRVLQRKDSFLNSLDLSIDGVLVFLFL